MKIKDFRREIRKFGDREIPTIWCAGGDPIPVPSLMEKLKERAKI